MDVGAPTMESIRMRFFKNVRLLPVIFVLSSCASSFLKYEKEDKLRKIEEFERQVVVKEVVETPTAAPVTAPAETDVAKVPSPLAVPPTKPDVKKAIEFTKNIVPKDKKTVKSSKGKTDKATSIIVVGRQPDIEDSVGFDGNSRQPLKNPFRVGEKVIHAVSYFAAEAGTLNLEVRPFLEVNGRKSYNFLIGLKSSSLFSKFYSVDDQVETYLDYENLVPPVLKMSIRETGKLAQASSYFNFETLKANFWEKKYTEKSGEEEKKLAWDILPFSQNAYSGLFYMRIFQWEVGKEYAFRVSEDEKNIVFKGKALLKEKLDTDAGEFNAIKIKASILSRGALTQTGDVYIWISDDDRKYILRIEAKIKIGTIISEVSEIIPGRP